MVEVGGDASHVFAIATWLVNVVSGRIWARIGNDAWEGLVDPLLQMVQDGVPCSLPNASVKMGGVWRVKGQLGACRKNEGGDATRAGYGDVKGGASAVDAVGGSLWKLWEIIAGVVSVRVVDRLQIGYDSDVALGTLADQASSSVQIVSIRSKAGVQPRGVKEHTKHDFKRSKFRASSPNALTHFGA